MPRIDPLQLLTCLKVLLDKNGGILSLNEVKRIAGLMTKYSKKLVSKCIYIQILKCTKTDLLGEFMGAGGWQLVNLWLTDGLRAMNYPLVTEILELFLLCPVDVERLKSNTSPKLVKQLSREGPPDVRILATRLVEQWLNIVKASNLASNNHATSKVTETSTSDSKITSKTTDTKKDDENSKTDKIENVETSKSPSTKTSDSTFKSSPSPKRKLSTESSSSLTLKIVVKDGKQVVSKVEECKEDDTTVSNESKERDEADNDGDQQSESDESSDKLSNKENENKSKDEENEENQESKDIKDKDKQKEKDKNKDKVKDKTKSSSSKDKDRHKSSNSSSKSSSKSHSSSTKNSSSSSSSSSKSKHSNKNSNRDKDRDSDKDKDREKDKDHKKKSSNKSSSKDKHKHEREKSLSKEKEREKEKTNQAEKDKDTLNKVLPPSLEKLGKIPKKPRDPNDPEALKPTSITIPSKKASMSIEIRKDSEKAKTVKTYKSQFRSHGLTEEAPPPPSRKQLKKPTNVTPVSVPAGGILGSSNFASTLKRSSPPLSSSSSTNTSNSNTSVNSASGQNNAAHNSGPPAEKKPRIDMTGMPSNIVEKPGSIKLIAPKPKPSLVESDLFMDALSAAAYKKNVTKRKRRPSNSANAESPTAPKVEPLKFYQDTLEAKEDDKSDTKLDNKSEKSESENDKESTIIKIEDDDDDIPLKKVKEDIDLKTSAENTKEDNEKIKDESNDGAEIIESSDPKSPEEPYIPIKKPPGPGCGPDGPPGVLILHRRTGPKKKLKWRPQEDLEEIRYFELDENERVNVTKAFTDMKNMERMHEREAFLLARKLNNEDLMVEQMQWRPLIEVDDVPPHPDPGCKSKEKTIQAERERTTLKALYFSHAMIPDSPSEPDMEQCTITEPKIIPLDDITGSNSADSVNDFVSYGYPEPKGTPPPDHQDDPMDGGLNLTSIPGTEIPFGNQNNQFNPFLPFGGQPVGNNNMGNPNNWVAGLGPNGSNNMGINNILPPNNMNNLNNVNNINMLRSNVAAAMNGPMAGNMNGPPPLMATAPLGPINNGPFNMPHNILPFGPNGPPPNGMNGSPQNLLSSIFGPNGIQQQQQQRMNMNAMHNGPMHNQMGGGNRNQNSGGNWRSAGGLNNNNSGNWRSNNNDRGNNRNNDRSNWVHGNANRSVCKQFLRGFCRNGNKCNYIHPGNNQRI
ncbi:serine/threonine-protein phosphatase 1 regulatory subunit 10 [Condylostylus longicornis]|uniref:serine/threonine-protein phosphatase 1 regulatory subunit 10 n=1 Tax=Condylostylus longicornis TaxID=2530218 RepID=UPI00244DAFA6|nr:serine/threonine-protein phosphatase 1 regulatory subunit 10 [Condylostylus longicornis]XP_055386729.1 serine/threonine-protein phosphatase 1 regulatory subunit 10 [Condylostylus longicornis]XP_055386730.1 serine/threonine-protein phosphatase 1 regulatory subunit 10 [Condylostylus longicornis]XP_055386731.1 serine/threonine-protein phosphatase 1 regulatory subunit 10 [Condylostylus longicornis]XP_055386732.1 serine/threonine-protein phosphatase 1 regulatory subunit 10 [Condylostylus longicor